MSALENVLRRHGWLIEYSFDLCWLDCPEPGYLLIESDRGRCICLCLNHALDLQAGCWEGDYTGAPLPATSQATSWPWQPFSYAA